MKAYFERKKIILEEINLKHRKIILLINFIFDPTFFLIASYQILKNYAILHGETFYTNFYYSIFQFREKCITLRIFVSKNTKLYNNDMKLQHSS